MMDEHWKSPLTTKHKSKERPPMKYMFLIYGSEAAAAQMSQAERQQELMEYNAFSAELHKRELQFTGDALHPTTSATTVRLRSDKTMTTDGPFAETHEALGGFYIVDCKDLDEAIQVAAMIPGAKTGSIEIRPVVVWS
jgi:hypothetical protein